jgi:hypothetical protein
MEWDRAAEELTWERLLGQSLLKLFIGFIAIFHAVKVQTY